MTRNLLCFLTALWCLPLQAIAQGTPLQIIGSVSYQRLNNDTSVRMTVDRIANTAPSGRSGTIYLGLWATNEPSPVGSGYELAKVNLGTFASNNGTLEAGTSFTNIETTTAFTRPPAGEYYMHMYIAEHPNADTIIDHVTIGSESFASTSGVGGGGGGALNLLAICFLAALATLARIASFRP